MPAYAVIPLGATRRDTFTYDGPAGVERGQLVRIPLGPRRTLGVVSELASPVPHAKPLMVITGVRLPSPMIDLVEWTAKTYHVPVGTAARLMLPTWLKEPNPWSGKAERSMSATEPGTPPQLLIGTHRAAQYEAIVKGVPAFLILVPEIALAESLSQLERQTGAVRFHSGLTVAKRQEIWSGVATGQITKVIGTRAALWLPWPTLSAVIVDEEDDRSYKSDRAPRYHARSVAGKLAALYSATLTLASAAPSLESWHHAATRQWDKVQLREPFPELITVPLGSANEPLSAVSLKSLAERRTLLWAPQAIHKRIATAVTDYYSDMPVLTPGAGFGSRVQVERFRKRPAAVMIGSTALTHPWDFGADQVIVTGIDGLLQQPDFRAGERVHAILRKLAGQARHQLLIQTDHNDFPAIARLGRDPEAFYRDELSERHLLKLPPFRRLSRLELKHGTTAQLEQAARQIEAAELEVRPVPNANPLAQLILGDPERLPRPTPVGWTLDVDTQRAT